MWVPAVVTRCDFHLWVPGLVKHWKGFCNCDTDCVGDSLFLPHTGFANQNNPAKAECNAGGFIVMAEGVSNISNSYMSIVIINVTQTVLSQLINLTIECYHNDGTSDTQVGTSQILTSTGM